MEKDERIFWWIISLWAISIFFSCLVFGPLSGTLTSAFHARMVELFRDQFFPTWDPLSYGGRLLAYYPFGYFISGIVTRILPANVYYTVLPAACFLIYLYFVLKLHSRFSSSAISRTFTLLIATFAFTSFGRFFIHQIAHVLVVSAVYYLLDGKNKIAGVLAGLTLLTHGVDFVFFVLFALALLRREALGAILLGIALALPYYAYLLARAEFYIPFLDEQYRSIVTAYWTDVTPGVKNLLKLRYMLFLGIAGAMYRKNFLPLVLAGFVFVFPGSRFISPLGILFFSVPASALIEKLEPKNFLFYGVVGFSLLYVAYAVGEPLQTTTPEDLIQTLHWIRDNTPEDVVVVSNIDYAHLVAYYSKRKTFADGLFEFADLKKASLCLEAFRGSREALTSIDNSTKNAIFLIKRGSPPEDFLRKNKDLLYSKGDFMVFGSASSLKAESFKSSSYTQQTP